MDENSDANTGRDDNQIACVAPCVISIRATADDNSDIPTWTSSSAASLGTSSSSWCLLIDEEDGIGICSFGRMASSLETMESRVTMEWS